MKKQMFEKCFKWVESRMFTEHSAFRHNDFLQKTSRWGVVKKVSYHLQEKRQSSVPCPILLHSFDSFALLRFESLLASFQLHFPSMPCTKSAKKNPAMFVDNIMDKSSNCQNQNRIIQKDSKSKTQKNEP